MPIDSDWLSESCRNCRFWASYAVTRDAKGQCTMVHDSEPLVLIHVVHRKKGEATWKHDMQVDDEELGVVVVTDHDFGCRAFQLMGEHGEHAEDEPEDDDPAEDWKST